jgi:hypothetical protein
MRALRGRLHFPPGWAVLAYRRGGPDVALCPDHLASQAEWERRWAARLTRPSRRT